MEAACRLAVLPVRSDLADGVDALAAHHALPREGAAADRQPQARAEHAPESRPRSDSDSRSARAPATTRERPPLAARRPFARSRHIAIAATRLSEQPVVAARSVPGYGPIFNAGVIHHDGRYHLFARAVRDGYRRNPLTRGAGAALPRLHLRPARLHVAPTDSTTASSRSSTQVQPGRRLRGSARAAGRERRQTSLPAQLHAGVLRRAAGTPWRAALSELTYNDGAFSLGRELLLGPEQVPNKDVVLCNLQDGRIALIQRLEPPTSPQQSIQVATFASLEELWEPRPDFWRRYMEQFSEHIMLTPSPGALGVGAGAPPVPSTANSCSSTTNATARTSTRPGSRCSTRTRRACAQLLPYPILTPQLPWELDGDVNNVVFVQGAHLRDDGTIYLTYGAADSHIGAATVEVTPLLAALHGAEVDRPIGAVADSTAHGPRARGSHEDRAAHRDWRPRAPWRG